jgi:hypothetical protein
MPSIRSLCPSEKLELIQLLAADLADEEKRIHPRPIVLPPEDRCPYTPEELAAARAERGPGHSLAEIRKSLGWK